MAGSFKFWETASQIPVGFARTVTRSVTIMDHGANHLQRQLGSLARLSRGHSGWPRRPPRQ